MFFCGATRRWRLDAEHGHKIANHGYCKNCIDCHCIIIGASRVPVYTVLHFFTRYTFPNLYKVYELPNCYGFIPCDL